MTVEKHTNLLGTECNISEGIGKTGFDLMEMIKKVANKELTEHEAAKMAGELVEKVFSEAPPNSAFGFTLPNDLSLILASTFACEKCGNCCRISTPITLTIEDPARISISLNMKMKEFIREYARRDGPLLRLRSRYCAPCIFLENNSCKIYEARPTVCRQYPFNTGEIRFFSFCGGSKNVFKALVVLLVVQTRFADELRKKREQWSPSEMEVHEGLWKGELKKARERFSRKMMGGK